MRSISSFIQDANAQLKEAEELKDRAKKFEQELEVSFRPSWFINTRQAFIGWVCSVLFQSA